MASQMWVSGVSDGVAAVDGLLWTVLDNEM